MSCSKNGLDASAFLPTTAEEMRARGWDQVDVALRLRRCLRGSSVLCQWLSWVGSLERARLPGRPLVASRTGRSADPWRQPSARPRLFFAVSAGNMDSMINHYTANRKPRNGGRLLPRWADAGSRPDRADQRLRPTLPRGLPRRAGGHRRCRSQRCAGWRTSTIGPRPCAPACSSHSRRRTSCGYGMGETADRRRSPKRLNQGLGASVHELPGSCGASPTCLGKKGDATGARASTTHNCDNQTRSSCPAFEDVREDKLNRSPCMTRKRAPGDQPPECVAAWCRSHGDRTGRDQSAPALARWTSRDDGSGSTTCPTPARQHPSYGDEARSRPTG